MRVQIWRTQSDGQVRESHRAMEGVRVAIDEPFEVAGERLFLPCDTQGSFEETAGCRCFVEFAEDGAGQGGQEEDTFEDIRSVELATRIARLRRKYGVGLNDALRGFSSEQIETLFGPKLTESEVIRNIEDFEAELDRTLARGRARGNDWALERLRETTTNLGDREPKDTEGKITLGRVNDIKAGSRVVEQTIVFKPELSEDEARGLAARALVGPSTMFARESGRSPEAAKRYTIRHELGHALQNAKGAVSSVLSELRRSANRKLSKRAAKDDNELVAELIAWYTSPDYDGSLDAEVEAALDDLLR